MWLLGKTEKRILIWSHRWLTRAGRLVLIKYVLEAIPVYWMSLAWILLSLQETPLDCKSGMLGNLNL